MGTVNSLLSKHEDIILVGDWNETPKEIYSRILRLGPELNVKIWAPKTGTRIIEDVQTMRTLDFAIGREKKEATSLSLAKEERVSDHIPIVFYIEEKTKIKEEKEIIGFDRSKLKETGIAKAFKNYNYTKESEDRN
ncbi:hypothetical protein PAEPH01_2070 [Pancytospora epiphaga]|nr:hypothetical protein PAEPH01_2070 [Pancytospora epiphaga]